MIAKIPRERFKYVLEADKKLPKEQQTVFHLRAMSAEEEAHIVNLAWTHGPGTGDLERVIRGLKGWNNLRDEAGNPVVFKERDVDGEKMADPSSLDYIEGSIPELSRAIRNRFRVTEDDVKN